MNTRRKEFYFFCDKWARVAAFLRLMAAVTIRFEALHDALSSALWCVSLGRLCVMGSSDAPSIEMNIRF